MTTLEHFAILLSAAALIWLYLTKPQKTAATNNTASNAPWWFTSPVGATPASDVMPQLASGQAGNSYPGFGNVSTEFETVQF